ncbi:MAG: hypothetical protein H7331_05580 [Bacteroidia bacterium]|nr:hypothetical protein [Bacteroidia bacterium]
MISRTIYLNVNVIIFILLAQVGRSYCIASTDSLSFIARNNNYFMFNVQPINVPNNLNIVHIGDSHIQAGHWGNNLMQGLDSNGFESTEAVVLPHRFMKGLLQTTNLSIQTFNEYSIKSCAKNKYDSTYTHLSYFKSTDSIIGFIVKHNIDTQINFETNANYTLVKKTAIKNELSIDTLYYTRRDTGSFMLWNITKQTVNKSATYYNLGLNGASYKTTAKYINLYMPYVVKASIIIISLGANDAYNQPFDSIQFYKDALTVINACYTKSNAHIIITNAGHAQYTSNELCTNTTVVNNVLKKIAIEYNLTYWNWYAIMGNKNCYNAWLSCGLARNDYIHLTPQGYKLQANLFNSLLLELLYKK